MVQHPFLSRLSFILQQGIDANYISSPIQTMDWIKFGKLWWNGVKSSIHEPVRGIPVSWVPNIRSLPSRCELTCKNCIPVVVTQYCWGITNAASFGLGLDRECWLFVCIVVYLLRVRSLGRLANTPLFSAASPLLMISRVLLLVVLACSFMLHRTLDARAVNSSWPLLGRRVSLQELYMCSKFSSIHTIPSNGIGTVDFLFVEQVTIQNQLSVSFRDN